MSTGPADPTTPGPATPAADTAPISGQVADRPDPPWPPRPDDWRHDAPDPPEAFQVPWSWWDGLVLAVWSLVAQAAVLGAFIGFGSFDPDQGGIWFWIYILTAQAVTLGGILGYLRARGVLSWRLLGPVRPAAGHVGIGFLVGVTGWLIIVALTLAWSSAFGPVDPPDQPVLRKMYEGGLAPLLGFLAAAGFAPLVEETIFRGVLFLALRGRAGLWPAVVLSSLLFGLAHLLAPLWMVMLTVLGLWLAGAFHRFGSLIVPVVGHATFNAIMLTLALLAPHLTPA